MKKLSVSFHGVKILIAISFSILIYACNGQENQNKSRGEFLQIKTDTQHSIIEHNQTKEQISQVVRKIFQDSQGNIWFGTQNGAFRLTNKSLTQIDHIKSESGTSVTIKDITEDKDGKIWLGHTDGISSIHEDVVINYYESDGLISNDVWNIETDANGNVWIGTIAGVCRFNGHEFINFDLPEGELDSTLGVSSTKMVHSILEDSKGDIWFSTNAGLFKFSNNAIVNVSKKVGIETNFINEIIENKPGEFWISTKEALYKMTGDQIENITEAIPEVGKGVGTIAADTNGNMWFVFNQHQLYKYDGANLIEIKKSRDNERPVIFQIFNDHDNRLWFVGYGGAYRLENEQFVNITKNGPW